MSKCFGCYFYNCGYMWNRCDYFESEYYREPDDCLAFSVDGSIPAENEAKLYEQTCGFFGKPLEQEKTVDDINHKIIEISKAVGTNWLNTSWFDRDEQEKQNEKAEI